VYAVTRFCMSRVVGRRRLERPKSTPVASRIGQIFCGSFVVKGNGSKSWDIGEVSHLCY